jgi:hypothetical protein
MKGRPIGAQRALATSVFDLLKRLAQEAFAAGRQGPSGENGAERIGATAQRRLNLIGKLNRWFSSRRTAAAGIVVLRQSRTLPERLSGDRSFARGRREFKGSTR